MSFELTTLGEYISIQGGYAYKSQQFIENSTYPVLKIKNIRTGYVDINDCAYIDKNSADETERYIVSEGDVLISLTGSGPNAPQSLVGRVARFWDKGKRAWINQRVGRVVLKKDKTVHKDFIFYFLGTKESQNYLVANSSGSANQANINGAIIEALPFPRIDYSTSKKISKVLRTLDEKINLNNQINQTLESIAQAIFKSWFIDFEPVRAKIAAKQTGQDPERAAMCAISGKSEAELEQMAKEDFAELQATAALFPDELVESELGEVPKGWSIAKVDGILNRIKIKKRFKKNDVNEFGRTFVLEQGSNIILGFHNDEGSIPASKEEPVFIFGDHTCITKLMLSNFDVSENVIAVTGKERNSYWTYYAIRDLQKFQEYRRHWMELVSKQVVMADLNLTDYFAKKVKTLHEEIENFVHENLVLINLRDTLLPKLLSGEVDVSDLHGEGV